MNMFPQPSQLKIWMYNSAIIKHWKVKVNNKLNYERKSKLRKSKQQQQLTKITYKMLHINHFHPF